jgi:hypothetical protein
MISGPLPLLGELLRALQAPVRVGREIGVAEAGLDGRTRSRMDDAA